MTAMSEQSLVERLRTELADVKLSAQLRLDRLVEANDHLEEERAKSASLRTALAAAEAERDEARSGNRYAQLERLAITRAETAEAKLAAAEARIAAPAVKPLEWDEEAYEPGWWMAQNQSVFLGYEVHVNSRGVTRIRFPGEAWRTFEGTPDAAKAAAQADYEARIRSALTHPTPPAVPAGVVESGPVPTHECPFIIGQPVHLANPYPEMDPSTVFYVTGISWEHRMVSSRGWNIMVAGKEDIEKGYGQTDGYSPDDLLPALRSAPVEGE